MRLRLRLPMSIQSSLSRREEAPIAFLDRRLRIARCSFALDFSSSCRRRSPLFATNTRRFKSCLFSSSFSLQRFLIWRRQRLSSSEIVSASKTVVQTRLAMFAPRARVKLSKNLAHIRLSRRHAAACRKESLKKTSPYDSSHMKAAGGPWLRRYGASLSHPYFLRKKVPAAVGISKKKSFMRWNSETMGGDARAIKHSQKLRGDLPRNNDRSSLRVSRWRS